MYVHLIPVWLFGKSVACVRATTAAVTLFGVATGGLALRAMRNRFWWSAPLVAGATPLFFVHARLGFETAMMASFYFAFLWAYFLYRTRDPRWVFAAFVFGAATFYAYTAGQGVMLVTGLALAISDFRYHREQIRAKRRLFAVAVLLTLVLAVPYVRYRRLHPGVVAQQLEVLDSYWTHPIPLSRKLALLAETYAGGFDPRYWFRFNEHEVPIHRMDSMPFLPRAFAPLIAVGIVACAWNFRRSPLHRAVLLSPLGVPFSAAVANLQILRLMAMVVPATLLTIVGVDWLYRGLARWRIPWAPIAVAGALVLGLQNARLTRDALERGAGWFQDYGFRGAQWGAPQVFAAIREELSRSPDAEILLSSNWANNPKEFIPFFLNESEAARVRLKDILEWDFRRTPLVGNEVFVMTPDEWDVAAGGKKFLILPSIRVIPYPNGQPGFRFVRLRYSPDADRIFTAEKAERSIPLQEETSVHGERWNVEHSRADIGTAEDLFDGRLHTILRGLEANPFVLDIRFPSPRAVREIEISLGTMDLAHLRVRAFPESGGEKSAELVVKNRPAKDWIAVPLPASVTAVRVRIEIADGDGVSPAHIEVREVKIE